MGPRWGDPPWTVVTVVPAAPPPSRCDVAVLGGGLTGLSAALALARRGLATALFEAGRIGDGASGRTGAIVLEGTAAGPLEDVDDCVPRLEETVREAGIDCGLVLSGCWELGHRAPAPGATPLWRDGDGSLYVAGTVPGGSVDAGALVGGLAAAALRAGATIHEHSPVRRLELEAPVALHLDSAIVRADAAVVALNAWMPRLVPLADEIRSALTLAVCAEPLEARTVSAIGLADRMPFYTIDLPYLWGRCRPDGRVLFGAGLHFGSADELEAVTIADSGPHASLDRLEARFRGLHPALSGVRIEQRWAGPIAIPAGRPPLLGRHQRAPHVIVAGAYAGHGVALGVRAGQLAAHAVAENRSLPAWGALR